jgi:hypothetical protein
MRKYGENIEGVDP